LGHRSRKGRAGQSVYGKYPRRLLRRRESPASRVFNQVGNEVRAEMNGQQRQGIRWFPVSSPSRCALLSPAPSPLFSVINKGASIVGKYILGWILGVPVVVLVLIYLFFH
jgi:hypothetical protein